VYSACIDYSAASKHLHRSILSAAD
jgi:hypothetical protein